MVIEPRLPPTLKEGTPKIVMLRELTIVNTRESINKSKILTDMANIGGGAPSTKWKGNLMKCT